MIDYSSVGGKLIQAGQPLAMDRRGIMQVARDDYWSFGWVAPEARTESQWDAMVQTTQQATVPFAIQGRTDPTVKKVDMTELWTHPHVIAALQPLGFTKGFPGSWQLTGSCVGSGGCNTIASLSMVEVIRLNDPEQIILPLWLYTYGRSRFHMGDRGQGEGSLESAWAKAAQEDGAVSVTASFVKPNKITDIGFCYTSNLEMRWSDGDGAECMGVLDTGRKHLIRKAGRMRDHNDVREAICNYYPVGEGSMYGYSSWVDSDGLSMGKRGPRWSHKQTIQGWMEHPKYGELFKMVNQWDSASTDSGKFNYVWIPPADVDWICQDECFCYSQFDGFPAQSFHWSI